MGCHLCLQTPSLLLRLLCKLLRLPCRLPFVDGSPPHCHRHPAATQTAADAAESDRVGPWQPHAYPELRFLLLSLSTLLLLLLLLLLQLQLSLSLLNFLHHPLGPLRLLERNGLRPHAAPHH